MLPTFQRFDSKPRSVTVWEGGRADNDVSLIITKDSLEEGENPKTDQSRVRGDFRDWERRW